MGGGGGGGGGRGLRNKYLTYCGLRWAKPSRTADQKSWAFKSYGNS